MSDLKKGTIYAWQIAGGGDIRRLENFVRVEYLGPAEPHYDKYRPTKKLNVGVIRVKLLQEHKLYVRWSSEPPQLLPIGHVVEVDAKALLLAWADLVERAGETHAASLAAEAYMQSLKDLLKEVAPELTIDHAYSRSYNDRSDIQVNLHHGDSDTEFDPTDVEVSLQAEVFRKLLQGVADG
jgi:hypothetical protein